MDEAVNLLSDGMVVMVGGFLGCGSPKKLINAIVKSNVKDLTLICNDTSFRDYAVGKMIVKKQFSKVIVSHIGTNKETIRQMNEGETKVELVPQGTLVEQIRCAGFGLGGFFTPTGVGTEVENGKEKKVVDGITYIYEKPLKADVALLYGSKVDKKGNVFYNATTRNFNPVMAQAADIVIVEAEEIVEVGELDPNCIATPHIFVNYVVGGEK